MLHMLWTGEGLQQLAILPGDLPTILALWLPRLFKGALVLLLILISRKAALVTVAASPMGAAVI